MENTIKIRAARKEDAPIIAKVVMMALHDDGCQKLAGGSERLPLLEDLFTHLCESDNSQYSYLNSLIAEDDNGEYAGAIVAYDGVRMHDLRHAFVDAANSMMGYNLREEEMDNETDASEIYLDSVAVFAPFRGQGLASRLIDAAIERHKPSGKPFGLLCDPDNINAYNLYSRLGFVDLGMRKFAGIPMRHMQKNI